MAALGSQSIASSYEQLLHVDADGGGNSTTHVSVKDGDNGTTFGFTIASDALMMSSTNRLEFGDTGTYIHQSADGVLDLVSDTELELNATTIDINGAVDISGATQLNSTLTVGANDTGYDVIFHGDTDSSNMHWDTSADELVINDGRLYINQDDNDNSIYIDSEATTGIAVFIDTPTTTQVPVLKIADCNSLTTGSVAQFHSNASDNTSSRNIVEIINDNVAADNAVGLLIQQDGADASIELTGNGSIKFPGTQGASSDANSLDDYEEGTWTPVLGGHTGTSGQSYGSQNGTYTKVGRSVTCCFYVDLSTDGSISGDLRVLGLPFTCGSGKRSAAALGYITKFTLTADHYITNYVEQSSTHIHLLEAEGEGDSVTSLAAGAVEDGTQLMGSVTYFV